MKRKSTAVIISSGRRVRILIEGDKFFVVHAWRGDYPSVSGEFSIFDRRFQIVG